MPVIALAGNPNTGKTTLFNLLTDEKGPTGNWPGVTVEKREGALSESRVSARVIDLPGAYSLTPCCREEEITQTFLKNGEADIIINVLNPSFLRRELYLTHELLALGKPVICALNMADEMEKNNISLNIAALSASLGVPVLSVSAKNGTGLRALIRLAEKMLSLPSLPSAPLPPPGASIHTRIDRALLLCAYTVSDVKAFRRTEKIDRILLGKYTAFPFLILVTVFMFSAAFGMPGQFLTLTLDRLFAACISFAVPVRNSLPAWADSLIRNGVLTGVFSVLSFLPQVAVLYFFTAFIEESGYMARAAFITDKLLRRIGLSGRSMIHMIMGLGCTTAAVAASRGSDSERDRKMTAMLMPFVSCGAKMPVYALIASECFGAHAPLAVMGVYLIGFLVLSASGALLNRVLNRKFPSDFLLELPPYRLPEASEILKKSLLRLSDFAKRTGTVIVLTSAVSWFLIYHAPDLTPAPTKDASILACMAQSVSFLFRPLGFGSWKAVSALISGFFAKESILSSLRIFSSGSVREIFYGQNAFSYLVFILLSPPCAGALAAIRRSLASFRLFAGTVALQLAWAFSLCAIINLIS